ncbi:Ser/Thr protein phosphatase, putative [Trichomonas vaginalis G3]|uniref:Serine/threonine-protein phosphatase n=1 Tax=Trichomonas vaginalis (strain ATCC PRA-98 / G3) TaxID=412133 RepID=A2EG17_TRIV3|nr:phosphoprotein phosphatase protein [Trichomonas vaginalis G3]EAY08378.1 Ser/Thr protein phosphatase, putative [Trichomonas vaginalis G3]KAI5499342.1 phosphoprotein phosphatase protein [Trichomonas vaginalis G3]|eukprot:XP_001320601.1 Ser/Thr protein phosphatase [Trichomonas vaginalis G3]
MNYNTKKLNKILKAVERDIEYVIDQNDILWLCTQIEKILRNEPPVLFLEAPITVVGDLHGKLDDLNKVLEIGGSPRNNKFLFLGDYVDRGKNSVEVIVKLLCLKIKYPDNVYLLRGNHESDMVKEKDGLKDKMHAMRLGNSWFTLINVFRYLSIAAVINNRIFCVHAGLSPELESIDQIMQIQKPIDIPDVGLVRDLLWSDPSTTEGYNPNEDRLTSVTYGPDVTMQFLKKHKFQLLVRAHQVSETGYEFPFPKNNCAVTIYSSNAGGNTSAVMLVSEDLEIEFVTFKLDEEDDYKYQEDLE